SSLYYHLILLFLFQSHGAHRALPSFPTRRSSDLETRRDHSSPVNAGALPKLSRLSATDWEARRIASLVSDGKVVSNFAASREARSEEHTSELQSLTNLVCRLLLEKKKTYKSIQHT